MKTKTANLEKKIVEQNLIIQLLCVEFGYRACQIGRSLEHAKAETRKMLLQYVRAEKRKALRTKS